MKNQMMCCGTARFSRHEAFGPVLGQVKAELSEFGKVISGEEADPARIPATTGPCDLFLDASTPWRRRYIAAQVHSAGEEADGEETLHYYAVSLKEGHSSGWLRSALFIAAVCLSTAFAFSGLWRPWSGLIGLVLLLFFLYRWIAPGRSSARLVGRILRKLESLSLSEKKSL